MSDTMRGLTRKFQVAGWDIYIQTGFNGCNLEFLAVTAAKVGSAMSGLLHAWAKAVSISLEMGMQWSAIAGAFKDWTFEPRDDESKSIIDGIVREVSLMVVNWTGRPPC